MLVVVPFFNGDLARQTRNLEWAVELDSKVPFTAILAYEQGTRLDRITELADHLFAKVERFEYDKFDGAPAWPQPQNWAWQHAARYIHAKHKDSWYWWESDVTPLKPGWLQAIEREHKRGGRLFTGNLVAPGTHVNGACVLPWNVCDYSANAMFCRQAPWDRVAGQDIVPTLVHSANNLFQHVWEVAGKPPTFPTWQSVEYIVSPDAVVFHRCKDGTLIDRLREKRAGIVTKAVKATQATGQSVLQKIGNAIADVFPVRTRTETVYADPPKAIWKTSQAKLIHVVERHVDDDAYPRVMGAFDSWLPLYKSGSVRPVHVWHPERNSAAVGDHRQLPYLKDILVEGLTVAQDHDWIVLTNDDTVLHPGIVQALHAVNGQMGAVSSFRINFQAGTKPNLAETPDALAAKFKSDLGRDMFAFRPEWLRSQWAAIPDFFLGEQEWDIVMTLLIRESVGIKTTYHNILTAIPGAELPNGYVLHEPHDRKWRDVPKENAAKQWNSRLASEWCKERGYDYPLVAPP